MALLKKMARLTALARRRSAARLCVDVLNSDHVSGWALSNTGQDAIIEIRVDGKPVGQAVPRFPRPDVEAAHPKVPTAANSGFTFAFPPGMFAGEGMAEVTVELRSGRASRAHIGRVPRITDEVPARVSGPFPRPVLDALARMDRGYAGQWNDAHTAQAVRDLEVLVTRGSKRLPGLYAYLSYIAAVDQHARLVERHFPRLNTARALTDKDAFAVASSGMEMLAIAHHLFVLDSEGVAGCIVECGCFKGFSTSVLSFACHQLSRPFHVFDSFAGLPPSPGGYYRPGDFTGTFAEVTANVAAFGKLEPVRWHKGFFSESMSLWPAEPIALFWMDVDLEVSARDALQRLPMLARAGALFSHECLPENFVDGRPQVTNPGPEAVVQPILDAFRAAGRCAVGRFIGGNTGAFWDQADGIPVLPAEAVASVAGLARRLAG